MDERHSLRAQFLRHREQVEHILDMEAACAEQDVDEMCDALRDGAFHHVLSAVALFVRYISISSDREVEAFEELLEDLLHRELITQDEYELAVTFVMILQVFSDPDPEGLQMLEAVREELPLYAEQLGVLYTTMERVDTKAAAS